MDAKCTEFLFLSLLIAGAVTTPTPFPPFGISLADYNDSDGNGQAFYKRIVLRSERSHRWIDIQDIPSAVDFVVVQAHAREETIELSYDDDPNLDSLHGSNVGSNVGLVVFVGNDTSVRLAISKDSGNDSVETLIAAVAYSSKAPIPGGCNMEFPVKVSPFQKLTFNDATVTVDAQPASVPRARGVEPSCENHRVNLQAYRMYLAEHDFAPETYFDGIQKMLTVENIVKSGQKISVAEGGSAMHRVFAAYPGTGSIYALIASYKNFSAAYVPVASYACKPLGDPTSCRHLNSGVAKAICAMLLIIGLIVTFVGSKCLGFEVMVLGMINGGIFTYCIFSAFGYFETTTVLGIVFAGGFLTGLIWLILSTCMGLALVGSLLSSLTLGFFVAATFYFGVSDNSPLIESNVNFWLIFASIAFGVCLIIGIVPRVSSIICCSILGAYSIILPIDYYVSSNLKYIVINVIRRATVSGFNVAVVEPPFESTDKCLVGFLAIIALVGLSLQFSCCKLCCRKYTVIHWEDTARLVSSERGGGRIIPLGRNDRVENYR